MELYEQLASNDEKKRITAAEQLVKKIVAVRENGTSEKGVDFEYALNRLVKGLSSGRESARLGFSIALTEVLYEVQDVEASAVLEMIETHSTPSGNMSGMEERDFYFGRLFGITALIQSGILARGTTQLSTITRITDDLIALALKKPWLRESSTKALCTLITSTPILPDGKTVAEYIFKAVDKNGLVRSQDGAAIILALRSLPLDRRPKVSATVWQHGDPLHPSNLMLLSKVLREVQSEEDSLKTTGNFKSGPHFIWMFILQRYVENASDSVPFKSLWDTVVENGLFNVSSSSERKYLGYQLFLAFLPQLAEDLVGFLFTPNFLRCLVNNSALEDRYLNKAAKKSLSTIQSSSEARPTIAVTLIKALIEYSTKFDRLSKSKTVEGLYSVLQSDALPGLIVFLTNKIIAEGDIERRWYADQLILLLRQHPQSTEAFQQCLQFLCRYGFFTHSTLTKNDQEMLREKLFSLLALRISDTSEVWPSLAVLELEKLEDEYKKVIKLDSEIKKIRKTGLKRIKKLRSKVPQPTIVQAGANGQRTKGENSEQIRGLEMLFSLTLLQLYNGDAEAVSVLQELESVNVEENSGVLVEIILGLLSKPSVLLRKLSEQVFASFAENLTADGLKLLLDVLLTPETVSGAEELFDHEVDGDEEEEDDDEEHENDHESDEYMEDEDMDEDDEDDDDEENENEDIEMSENGDADEELDAALSAALGTTKPTTNGTPHPVSSPEDSSSEEELMNDEEMMALDESLATIFRQRLKSSSKAKQQKETKQQVLTFKCKVIDLLEILFKQPTPLVVDTLLPLLQVLRITKAETIHTKTLTILRKLAKIKDLPDFDGDWTGIMRKIHRDAERARGKDGNIHSQLSILLARIARKRGEEEEVVGLYAETMRNWIKNRKSMVRAGLFADWLNWCQSIRR